MFACRLNQNLLPNVLSDLPDSEHDQCVKQINIYGSTVFPVPSLAKASAFSPAPRITRIDVQHLTLTISDALH